VALALPLAANAVTVTGRVVSVQDGDTITLLDSDKAQHRIRISGIDAPERAQPFGTRSRQNMERMVKGKDVSAECYQTDRYGRQVCTVWLQPADCSTCGKTLDAGHMQILEGMAWWYRAYAKDQTPNDRGRYESAEQEARLRKWGLWRDANPVPPWEWRRAKTH